MLFYLISFLINPHLASLVTAYYNNVNSSSLPMLCHEDERSALLAFKNSMTVDSFDGYPFFSWKKGTDFCEWDGITCHSTSHHVVELNLFNSGLTGSLHSNSTLFLLRHLRSLYLSWNDFSYSPISPLFGLAFPNLTVLILGYSNFSGEVPLEIFQLSKLQLLDLSSSDINLLKISNINNIIANMTQLKELSLSRVNLDSTSFPPSLTNLSSLEAIELRGCNLRGELPFNLLNLPLLQYLVLGYNKGLYAHFPLSNWSSTLIEIDLSSVNFSSKLPSSFPALSPYNKLEYLYLRGCNFEGQIPAWVWNISIGNKTLDSYQGNLGLYGFPFPECGEDGRPRRQPYKGEQRDDDSENVSILSERKVIMMGYGFGTIVGSAWGYYMLSIGRPFWLLKLVYLIEFILRKFGRRRRRPTRGRN